jgi:hypothetical protein
MRQPSQNTLREIFDYDPIEPLALRWKDIPLGKTRAMIGQIAGRWRRERAGSQIYRRYIDLPGLNSFPVAHAVWIYFNGNDAPRFLAFKNGDYGDCRIENLAPNPNGPNPEKRRKAWRLQAHKLRNKFTDDEYSIWLRRRALRHNYKITLEQWEALRKGQNGVCAICGQPETLVRRGKTEPLATDHCHETKKVRGLLCHQCNNGLGRFFDSPVLLRAAADYIERCGSGS